MREDRYPLVGGSNGERPESLDQAEIERLCSSHAPFETVGGVRYSLWKTEEPLGGGGPWFSRGFFVALLVGSLVLLGMGRLVADQIRQGNFLLGEIFGISLFVMMYGGMAFAGWKLRRRVPTAGVPDHPPEGIPSDAVATFASVTKRGRTTGWLWFERDLMCFQGVGFDFRLRRTDFISKGPLFRRFRNAAGASLQGPRGVTEYGLYLRSGHLTKGIFNPDPTLWKGLEESFADWEARAASREPSLFPPIRPVETRPMRVGLWQIVAPILLMGGIIGSIPLIFGPMTAKDGTPISPWFYLWIGCLFGLVWPLMLWMENRTRLRIIREAEKIAGNG